MRAGQKEGRSVAAAASLFAACILAASATEVPAQDAVSTGERAHRPNIVVVLADDMNRAGLKYMRRTRQLIGNRGVRFSNAYATSPLCCPSRASILTGRYVHNHRVLQSDGPHGGHKEFIENVKPGETLPVQMSRAGYKTAYLGKYLNQFARDYPERKVPPGWDHWFGIVDQVYQAYGFEVSDNGDLRQFGSDSAGYQTDVLANEAAGYIKRASDGGPFMLMVAPTPPHQESPSIPEDKNPRAAPRHEGDFAGKRLPKPPSFNERRVGDKPLVVRNARPLRADRKRYLTDLHRNRSETLLTLDDLVGQVVGALRDSGELDNTVIIFTSDNGYMLGEHRLIGKREPYEESAGIPLLMRGPGVPEGAKREQLAANIDLMPTMLDIAGAGGNRLDGISLLNLTPGGRAGLRRDIVLEMWNRDGNLRYRGVRSRKWVYMEWARGDREMYDLSRDRYQLRSVHGEKQFRGIRNRLAGRLDELKDCGGARCH